MRIKAEIYLEFDSDKWNKEMKSIGYEKKDSNFYLKETNRLVSVLPFLPSPVYDVELVKHDCEILNPEEIFND